MFQSLRLAARKLLRDRPDESRFRARSSARDIETDRSRIEAIMRSIDDALSAAEREQAGLARRIEDVLARAAMTIGNNFDEYEQREPSAGHQLTLLNDEIRNGQLRLEELTIVIRRYNSLKATVLDHFPGHFG